MFEVGVFVATELCVDNRLPASQVASEAFLNCERIDFGHSGLLLLAGAVSGELLALRATGTDSNFPLAVCDPTLRVGRQGELFFDVVHAINYFRRA